MASPTFDTLRRDIASRNLAPVYLLHGEEGYFLDRLCEMFEEVLTEEEKEFNQHIFYGAQSDPHQVADACRAWPMMGDRMMVILKEAQAMHADQVNKLADYVSAPNPSTVFVMVFRGASAKGKDLLAAAKKQAVMFESKKISEYQIPAVLGNLLKESELSYELKALEMLRDFIGTDVSRLYNEVGKLALILGKGGKVTPEVVERNIGVSKDYNSFEFVDALAAKDARKCFAIAEYFKANPKSNPLVMTSATIFNFFSDLLVAQYARDKSDAGLMKALKLKSPYPLRRFRGAMQKYHPAQVIEIIDDLRKFDAKSKGNGSRQPDHALFRELIYRILTASGKISV